MSGSIGETIRATVNEPDISGTDNDDTLIGNQFNNVLQGLEGDDTLIAGAGNELPLRQKYLIFSMLEI
ncbi:MAG: hypothetical protein AAF228_05795 [Pseudomonadota bacterium]